jgi:thiamine pyrophosphokinase
MLAVVGVMRRVIIISGGVIGDREFLRRTIEEATDPVIICADGAARHVRLLGVVPAWIVGDMDSIDEDTLEYFTERGSRIEVFPRGKDETDTELALMCAVKLNPDEIWIVGALGGRIDHTLANISLLAMCVKEGICAKIIDEKCEISVVEKFYECEGQKGDTVSLLPLSSQVSGITLTGFEYPLVRKTMVIGKPYGISNRLTNEKGSISVESGYLLVIRNVGREESL